MKVVNGSVACKPGPDGGVYQSDGDLHSIGANE
jgi:hypothetical protein